MTTTPPLPAPASHGWRITWPMIVGWLVALSAIMPFALPYLMGEKKLDATAAATLFGLLVAAITHSPAPTMGGGLPRVTPPPVLILLVLVVVPALLMSCGGATAETRTAYAIEEERCVANERVIVDRPGTTEEEDRAALLAERARCDGALVAIGGAP